MAVATAHTPRMGVDGMAMAREEARTSGVMVGSAKVEEKEKAKEKAKERARVEAKARVARQVVAAKEMVPHHPRGTDGAVQVPWGRAWTGRHHPSRTKHKCGRARCKRAPAPPSRSRADPQTSRCITCMHPSKSS